MALVEGGRAGDLPASAPGPAHVAGREQLQVINLVPGHADAVVAHGAAVARRGAGHRHGGGISAAVEGGRAGDEPGPAPGAVRLADDECLSAAPGVVIVFIAGRAAR